MKATKLFSKLQHLTYFHCVRRCASNQFVPKHQPASVEDVQKLEEFLIEKQNVLVLTGAGCSTESGMSSA